MEPTLDKRLVDFMLLIANSPATPTHEFILQINGILLHRDDIKKMSEVGLNRLTVSMDAADPEIQMSLRGGASLKKVVHNVAGFRKDCPNTNVEFITTVTSTNIEKLESQPYPERQELRRDWAPCVVPKTARRGLFRPRIKSRAVHQLFYLPRVLAL